MGDGHQSEKDQDGFPINTVGNDEEGVRSTEDQSFGLSPISSFLNSYSLRLTSYFLLPELNFSPSSPFIKGGTGIGEPLLLTIHLS